MAESSSVEKYFRDKNFIRNPLYLARGFANLCRPLRYHCNLCGYDGRFWPFGSPPRPGAACGNCFCVERHRLIGLWLDDNPIDEARVLHFAAEPGLKLLFANRAAEYRTADLAPGMDLILNIEDIDLPDNSVDLVVCSHVLEHVDDAKALREIYRILTPGGRALLMFPIVEGWDRTYENSAHTTPAERTQYFGQFDHVRMFGRDVRERITNAGFDLTEFTAEEPNVSRYGLSRGEKIFIASKPA